MLNVNEPSGAQDWTAEKIAALRTSPREFIDNMMELLQVDSKPKIGVMLAKSVENKDKIPLEIRQCLDSALAKANS